MLGTAEHTFAAVGTPEWTPNKLPVADARSYEAFQLVVSTVERVADFATVASTSLLAYSLYKAFGLGKHAHYSISGLLSATSLFAFLFVFMLNYDGAYEQCSSLLRIRETERILKVSIQTFSLVFPATFFYSHVVSRWVVALDLCMVPLLLIVEKQLVLLLIQQLHARGVGIQKVLVYGAGSSGRSVFSALTRSPKLGLNPAAIVDDDCTIANRRVYEYGYYRKQSIEVIAGPLTSEMIQAHAAKLIIVAMPSVSQARLDDILATAFEAKVAVAFVPQLSHGSVGPDVLADHMDIDGVLLISLSRSMKTKYEIAKRLFDCCAASALLLLTAPLWSILALLIRRDSPGPVFFRQRRVGLYGREFELYKFRSMHVDVPTYGLHPSNGDDPRITHVGRWLRRTGLDELPQLINVIRGEMSLVGPRPEMPFIANRYDAHHRRRLDVIPGISGLWQLSADRAFAIHENLQYDLYYIRYRTFYMDMAILLHTALFAMRGV